MLDDQGSVTVSGWVNNMDYARKERGELKLMIDTVARSHSAVCLFVSLGTTVVPTRYFPTTGELSPLASGTWNSEDSFMTTS